MPTDIVKTGNKGEWSEIYAFFKILSDHRLSAADENLEPIEGGTFEVLNVIRSEKEGDELVTRTYDLTQENEAVISADNREGTTVVNLSQLRNGVKSIFESIQSGGGSFSLPEAQEFMTALQCSNIKASSREKTDIRLVIQDRFNSGNIESGFSIKTAYRASPTLLNASKSNTSFLYRVVRNEEVAELVETDRVRDRVQSIYGSGSLEFIQVESDTFRQNLEFIDSAFPNILAVMLVLYFKGAGSSIADLVGLLPADPSLQSPARSASFYEHNVKQFLEAIALGMTPATAWTGVPQANGGYIVVKENGELVCYHRAEREKFLDYLYAHTKFDSPSTTRHGYGSIETDAEGNEQLRLNIQIRFM